jgi:glycerol-3-phosphate dehydrogenase
MTEAMTGEHEIFDVAVIGGGVNGCGVARDLQGRGARVVLIEAADLAGGTSSASTKLIHGGLRYLEYYEFRLVREALMERERLWAMAPHIIWPLRFVLPHHKALRPAWMLRLGLFLYDHLGGRKLLPGFRRGFEYSDAWVEDARLVALNALDAAERGATILTRTKAVGFERHADHWRIEIDAGGERRWLKARALVNTAGPWAGEVLAKTGVNSPSKVRLVKGSHIVVRRLFQHDRAYIFQNGDGRVCFAIPYEQDFTLIGTTDVDFKDDPREVTASVDEIAYLCQAVSEYLARPVTPADVVWTYAGVRPLLDDGSGKPESATRDYVLERHDAGGAALVSVFGGKITTYRRLAEAVVAELKEVLPAAARPGWTASQPLPGGEFPVQSFAALVEELRAAYPWLAPELARRLARAYGRRAWRLLGEAKSMADLGQDFGAGLTAREVDYLRQTEWARTAEDVLWRRSKLGLRLTAEQVRALSDFMTG